MNRLRPNAPASPTAMPIAGRRQSLRHHLPQQPPTFRAERQADADLAAALRHHVGENAVGADGGEQQRESRKTASAAAPADADAESIR